MAETIHSTQPWRVLPTHLAEHIEQASPQGDLTEDDQHGGQGVGILKGMGRVDVEEAAAVRTQVFDDFHRGYRPLGDRLRLPIQGMHHRVGIEVLDHSLRDEDQRASTTQMGSRM